MPTSFDAIVIGSGFGGAIMARRLAEKGMRVLVLERGRRWEPSTYPRKPTDPWIFSDSHPALLNGWMDMRFYRGMTVAQAAGVGGGSLSYSSVAVEATPDVFTEGWPAEITHQELKPYYDTVAREMDLPAVAIVGVGERRRHPALGHHGVRLPEERFADEGHAHTLPRGLDGGAEPGSAGADDQDVVGMRLEAVHGAPATGAAGP
jgi:choline dehydrogenase-like flavoprotein